MSDLLPIPQPRVSVAVRAATAADIPFIDSLQKKHSRMVGFMPTKQIEGKVAAGQVLVAEEVRGKEVRGQKSEVSEEGVGGSPRLTSDLRPLTSLGYVIGQDRYFKRDDVGIIYQLNVSPGRQRGFVGATLLKAMFDRAAYGCRLFCCWCAQDIEANRFWEAMGFVPLAYRAGSERRGRVHIFWQKRIRAGDRGTPWWFPCQTNGGSIRADRLVLPIPPGTHWADEMPRILPGETTRALEAGTKARGHEGTKGTGKGGSPRRASVPSCPSASGAEQAVTRSSGLRFGAPAPAAAGKVAGKAAGKGAGRGGKRPAAKNDPRLVAAARELRDRYLEHVNGGVGGGAGGVAIEGGGKYDVSRALPETAGPTLLLPAA